ncbi:MAG: MarR family transcriptional regulator [Hyphomonadaceae bacterium]|jgi:DNA-binding MarR family transcriptional regulator|nr:MarR family transcriptional regulator [Hyphomonadaceae bacterium]
MKIDQLSEGLARLAAVSRQDDWRTGEVEGLTPTQGDILRLLMTRPKGVRLSFASAHIGVSQPTGSDAVSALERKGYLEKISDPADGRAVLLRATPAGKALARRWPMSFGGMIEALSESDRADLLGIVSRAILALQTQGVISRQRMCLSCRHFAQDAHPGKSAQHHCRLMDVALGAGDLRIDCPEHREVNAA